MTQKKWKYLGSAEYHFGRDYIGNQGLHWLEDINGIKHLASPVHKVAGKHKTKGYYKFKLVGWDVGKYGVLKPEEVKGYKLKV